MNSSANAERRRRLALKLKNNSGAERKRGFVLPPTKKNNFKVHGKNAFDKKRGIVLPQQNPER